MAEPGVEEVLVDRLAPRPVQSRSVVYLGLVWDVVREEFDLGEAGVLTRDLIDHPGAVAVLALDDEERVCLIQQYRHPVGAFEWELPAGLLDVAGEPPWLTAARELHEEVDLVARQWHTLLDHYTSPGGSSESIRIFLARDLTPVPVHDRHARDGEELGMPVRWLPLEQVRDAVVSGRVHNATLALGVFTAYELRSRGWVGLRPAEAPWPTQPQRDRGVGGGSA